MPNPPSHYRVPLYFGLNMAFVVLLGVGYAVGTPADPRLMHLALLFALCSSIVIDIDRLNGRMALLGLFMLVYFVSYGLLDLGNLFTGKSSLSASGDGGVFSKTEAVILIGGIMFTLGYRFSLWRADTSNIASPPRDWSKATILIIGPLLWAIGTYATYEWFVYIVPDTTNEAVKKGLASISSLSASIYVLGQMVQPIGILLIAYARRSFGGPVLLAMVLGMVVLQLLLGFVIDIKGTAVLGGVLVIMTSVLIDGRLPKTWLFGGLLFIVLVFPVFQAYRTAIHGERGLSRTAVIENFGKVLQLTLAAEDRVNSGKDRALTFWERSSLKATTEIIVEKSGNGVAYQWGHTLSPILTTFVPRVLWSGKQEVETGQMVNKEFHMTDSDDIFISPSHLGELYWNFGWPGAILGMGFIGILVGWVGARFNLAEYRTVTRILVTVVTIKQCIIGFEGAVGPGYVVWLRSLAGIGILHLIFARVPVLPRLLSSQRSGRDPALLQPDRPLFPNLLT
jgi:hypothetical protein